MIKFHRYQIESSVCVWYVVGQAYKTTKNYVMKFKLTKGRKRDKESKEEEKSLKW